MTDDDDDGDDGDDDQKGDKNGDDDEKEEKKSSNNCVHQQQQHLQSYFIFCFRLCVKGIRTLCLKKLAGSKQVVSKKAESSSEG